MIDYREVLLSLIGSLTLADHMGDAANDIWAALRRIGLEPPDTVSDLTDLGQWLGRMGIRTLYGTELSDD